MPLRKWTIRLLLYLCLMGLVFLIGHAILQPGSDYPPAPNLEQQIKAQQVWTLSFSILFVLPCMLYFVWGGMTVLENGPWRTISPWQRILLTGLLAVVHLILGTFALLVINILY